MSGLGQYLSNLAYDFIFFSSDVQTTTIAMAITGSLCCSIMWAIVHVITLIHDPQMPGPPKTESGPGGLPGYTSKYTSYTPHQDQLLQKSLMTNCLEVVCIRCGRLLSDPRCRYGMCSGCCLGRQQCQVHHSHIARNSVSMGLRLSGPKGIDLSNSCMSSVPERLGFVGAQLTYLNLSGNNLTELPPDIGCLQGLKELQLNDNRLTNIPMTIGSLPQLTDLDLRNNQLATIPESLWHLSSLKHLNLEYNKLTSLCPSVSHLLLLEELYLGWNLITSLPNTVGKLFNLKVLSARHSQIDALPASIGQLICLEQLDLVGCCLTSLPPSIGRCVSLRRLNLCQNRLSYLPSQVSQLQQLGELYVTDNSLSSFPASMENMPLNMFEVSGNPLITENTTVIVSSETRLGEFSTFPPLLELVARNIVSKKIGHLHLLPHSLQEYIATWRPCSGCRQPVFQYYRTRIRHGYVGKYQVYVPLKDTLCSPHLTTRCPRVSHW